MENNFTQTLFDNLLTNFTQTFNLDTKTCSAESNSLIASETSRAISAEFDASMNLDTETSRAIAAESNMLVNLDTETSRAISAEFGISRNLDIETSRALRRESVIATSLTTETGRAAFVRAGDINKSSIADATLTAAIETLVSDMHAAKLNTTAEFSTIKQCLITATNQTQYEGFRNAVKQCV